jgi:hypothetical protein
MLMLIFINLVICSPDTTWIIKLFLEVFRTVIVVVFYSEMYKNNFFKKNYFSHQHIKMIWKHKKLLI